MELGVMEFNIIKMLKYNVICITFTISLLFAILFSSLIIVNFVNPKSLSWGTYTCNVTVVREDSCGDNCQQYVYYISYNKYIKFYEMTCYNNTKCGITDTIPCDFYYIKNARYNLNAIFENNLSLSNHINLMMFTFGDLFSLL